MKFIILTFLCLCLTSLNAQYIAEGHILDETGALLTGTTVVLLDQDSSMVAFAISDTKGQFQLEDIEEGKYILQLSFVGYKTSYNPIQMVSDEKRVAIGNFTLEPMSEILQEVTVKAEHIPMGLLGDTISYNAAAFKTRPGATVEDLLKKLPGVEVQRDGSIKAMGKEVQNVLVDGKEFFGDDPKIATQNLEAEAIDKVQVFDKKSEIAEFTGIDDGVEEKTINLKLKEDYKSGGFGNVEVAGGTKERYKGKLNYNRFTPSMQASAIISSNNINEQAFSFNEYIQFMGGIGNAISSNGTFQFGEFGNRLAPQGLNRNISSGLNFNYDFSSKFKLTSHYFFLQSNQDLTSNTLSNQFTEAFDFISEANTTSSNRNLNHRLNFKLDYKPTPFTQLIWRNTFSGIDQMESRESNTAFTRAEDQSGMTSSATALMSDQLGYEGNVQLRKKYEKKGRNWISTANYQIGSFNEDQNVLNSSLFGPEEQFIDQFQNYKFNKNGLKFNTAYTEPVGKVFISTNYAYTYEKELPKKEFFDLSQGQSTLNEELSNQYRKTNQIHKGSISLRKNSKKYKFNSGVGIQWTSIAGSILGEQTTNNPIQIDNQAFHLLPSASFEYDLTKDKTIELGYRTSINLPTLNQLAPLPDNANPNILILGNPELRPEYNHHIDLRYSLIDQFNFKNFFFSINLDIIKDQILRELSIDDQLRKTFIPINTNNYKRISGYGSYSAPIRPLKLKFNISSQYAISDYTTNLNGISSKVNESNLNGRFVIENRKKENFDIAVGLDMDFNIRKYDVNESFNQSFFNYKLYIDAALYLGDTWSLSSKYDYVSYSSEFFAEKRQFNLLNASIRKSFNQGKVMIDISAHDLLNQNRGINRSGGLNALYETRFNTLSRYIMVGLKFKIGKNKKKGGISFG